MNPVLLVAALALLAACGGGEPEAKVLHVYNWADYIGKSTIRDFEARTGIKVTYDVFDSAEMLSTKLLTGGSGYDVVAPGGFFLHRDSAAGVFLELDKSKLPNLANVDPAIMRFADEYDPGGQHGVVYLVGTTGIGYNVDMIERALGTRTIDSWAAIFDPAVASKLAGCGIAMLDSSGDVLSLARLYLGLDMNSQSAADLDAAEAVLKSVRPYVRYFHSSQYVNDLATGEICISIGWVNGVHQARARGGEMATPVEVAYVVPKEGAPIWIDFMAIPVDAANPDAAHAFLNYLMEPEVIAGVSNAVGQLNAVVAATPFVDEKIRNDPGLYPTPEVMRRLRTYTPVSAEFSRMTNRAWTRIKSAQ